MLVATIGIIGVGAIGGAVACALQQTGRHELVLAGTRQRDGILVQVGGGAPVALRSAVITDPVLAPERVDLLILAVKSHQTAGAREWLQRLWSPGTPVVVLQNGVEQVETLTAVVPADRVIPGIVWCTAEVLAGDRVKIQDGANFIEVPAESGPELAAVFDGSFLEIRSPADFVTAAWRKLVFNAVVCLEALTGRRAEVFHDPAIAALALGLATECAAVGRAAGAELPADFPQVVVDRLRELPPGHGTSILYDRLAGRELEWQARNGVIRRVGARYGVPTPVSDVLVPLLAAVSATAQ